ncbi:MAG: lipocalin-like domain-containing protein [Chloroflexota bacterium]
MRNYLYLLLVVGLLGAGLFWWQSDLLLGSSAAASGSVTEYLSGESDERFARATQPNNIRFPEDLGPHDDFQTEWWYYTGNLKTAEGRDFGFQFTIFRRAIAPPPETLDESGSDSEWRTNQVYFAHFAVSDIEAGDFYAFEKFSRGSAGLAGAQAVPYRVWIEDWYVEEMADGSVDMRAQMDDVSLELNLTQTQPPVLHGDGGLSQKGTSPGNASYYYSQINQTSVGTIAIGEDVYDVKGHTWKDHEYSTSVLEGGATGWDWFSIQFDNPEQNALMFFQIRQEDGSVQEKSSGSWIMSDSSVTYIERKEIQLEVTDVWTSPESGIQYPNGWRIQIPSLDLDISGAPMIPNQEVLVSTSYWEGASRFSGTLNGEPVSAEGYVEMTGYE